MTIWKPVFALVVLIALAVSSRLVAQEQNTTPTAAVAGAWRLNRDLSTKVPEEMPGSGHEPGGRGRGTGGAPPGGGRGGSPGGGMGGPPGGGMGARPSEEEMRRMRGVLREASEAPDQFVIAPGDGMVTITDSTGLVQKFATTNKKEEHQTTAGIVETRTKWEGPVLTIETSAGGGLKITRSYRPAPEGRQLVVEVKIENSNVPQQMPPMRFVYEAISRPEMDRLPGD